MRTDLELRARALWFRPRHVEVKSPGQLIIKGPFTPEIYYAIAIF